MARDIALLPRPREIGVSGGFLRPEPGRFVLLGGAPDPSLERSGRIVQEALARLGARWELTAAEGRAPERIGAVLRVDPAAAPPGGYRLRVTPTRIEIEAGDLAAARHAAVTLRQVARQADPSSGIPCLEVTDAADYPRRGLMLDISRDRVPTMATLRGLLDLLEELKLNELQLYTEHTFAYRGHREVWEKASPLTGEEVLELDRLARERFVELVPNQNSFGHMERWLVHPRYRALAETPDADPSDPDGGLAIRSLCPLDPGSLALLEELYEELLPHFSSRRFNVGCDETYDVGRGQSREACETRGAGRVYLDFLLEIHRRVAERGRTLLFWGDIVLRHPELIAELPRDIVALDWGYEADHPFDEEGGRFERAGLTWYVCPGTSSWNSFAGRTDTALENIRRAAESGLGHGASGLLVTDWGDNGHPQPFPVALPFYAYAAAVAWGLEKNRDLDLSRALDLHVFEDDAGTAGKLALDLGNAYRLAGVTPKNASALALILLKPSRAFDEKPFAALQRESLRTARDHVAEAAGRLPRARMRRPDADRVVAEYRLVADLLLHACALGEARIEGGRSPIPALPLRVRERLASELEPLIEEYRRLWLARSRPGGLADSVGRLERVRRLLRGG